MLILNFVSPPLFPSERQSATSETAAVRFANAERGESGSLTCRNLKIADDGAGRCAEGSACRSNAKPTGTEFAVSFCGARLRAPAASRASLSALNRLWFS